MLCLARSVRMCSKLRRMGGGGKCIYEKMNVAAVVGDGDGDVSFGHLSRDTETDNNHLYSC